MCESKFLIKNNGVIILETYQCNRPKMLKKYKAHISFRDSLMFHRGVPWRGKGWGEKLSNAYCKYKSLKHGIRCRLIIGVETK